MSITGYASNNKAEIIGKLQTASLKIDPFEKCIQTHDKNQFSGFDEASRASLFKLSVSLPRNFEKSLLCARQSSADHGACPGDSGGPMVTEINDIFVQIAIIHGSLVKCSSKVPGIFVRTDNPKILSYIQRELNEVASSLITENRDEDKGTFCTIFYQ